MKKAIIYLRVSTGKQATEGASLDVQKKMCQEWAFRNDLLVDEIYHDDGVSAKNLERPELKKMLKYISENKGRISYLVTYQTDRLSRNVADFYTLLALLAKQGVEYKNVNSSIETDINNELVLGIEAVMAQHDNKVSDLKSNAIDYALQFMSNAPKIWSNASIEHQLICQKLVFPAGITYDLSKNEFGTAKLSALYTLANIKKDPSMTDESLVVTSRGIEPRLPG